MLIDDILKHKKLTVDGIIKIDNVISYCKDRVEKNNGACFKPEDCFSWYAPFENTWLEGRTSPVSEMGIHLSMTEAGGEYSLFCRFFAKHHNDYGYYPSMVVIFDKDGRFISWKTEIEPERQDLYLDAIAKHFGVLVTTLNLLACKNVELSETVLNTKQIKARTSRNKPYFEKTYALVIGKMTKMLDEKCDAITKGLKYAFHVVRGHWREYSSDRPLFGKYSGRFFIPGHARGDDSVGKINKTYEISAPK